MGVAAAAAAEQYGVLPGMCQFVITPNMAVVQVIVKVGGSRRARDTIEFCNQFRLLFFPLLLCSILRREFREEIKTSDESH